MNSCGSSFGGSGDYNGWWNGIGELKVCFCNAGVASYGAECPTHGTRFCLSCNSGYDLFDNACNLRTCTCNHGTTATATCPADGADFCSSCSFGSFPISGVCSSANICTCAGGTPATGINCHTNGADICSACGQGYYSAFNNFGSAPKFGHFEVILKNRFFGRKFHSKNLKMTKLR